MERELNNKSPGFNPQIRRIKESPLILTEAKKLGTWFQEDLDLRFAQWLNPKFVVWCNQRIKEIITNGFSGLTEEATDYIGNQIGKDLN